jgi:hypothetical protein
MIVQILDSNVQAANRQVRTANLHGLLLAAVFATFSVWTYFNEGGFLPYFLGFLALPFFLGSIASLRRKAQHPQTEDK